MTLLAASLLAGIGVGLSVAAPIGPTSMLCVQQTLIRGLATGIATGFGVATVHLIYGAVAAVSGAALMGAWKNGAAMSVASGLVLLVFSIRVFRRVVVVGEAVQTPGSLTSSYCGAIGFGFLNPLTPLLFAAAVPSLISQGPDAIPITIGGVFLGSLSWWAFLVFIVCVLRNRVDQNSLGIINRLSSIIIGCIAMKMIITGLAAFEYINPEHSCGLTGMVQASDRQ